MAYTEPLREEAYSGQMLGVSGGKPVTLTLVSAAKPSTIRHCFGSCHCSSVATSRSVDIFPALLFCLGATLQSFVTSELRLDPCDLLEVWAVSL